MQAEGRTFARSAAGLAACVAAAVLLGPSPAGGEEWTTFRHDARRTGASAARLDLVTPTVRWRLYVGGTASPWTFFDADVDADGRSEIVYVSGGRVIAKRGNNVAVWESEILPVDTLVGAVDFDADGATEILVQRTWPAPSQLHALSLADGSVVWSLPDGIRDWFGGVRVGDFDGDGRDDLYVGTGLCGTGLRTDLPMGALLSFCNAGACSYATVRTVWTLDPTTTAGSRGGSCGAGGQLGDVDGDGRNELVLSWWYGELPIYDAATGVLDGSLPAWSGDYDRGASQIVLANLDGDAALELVHAIDAYNASLGGRRVAAFDGAPGSYSLLWEQVGADRASDRLVFDTPGSVADLDGDGTLEVVASSYDAAGGAWTLRVRDARTGAERAARAGAVLSAVVDVTGDAEPEILGTEAGELRAYRYAAGALTSLWSLSGEHVVVRYLDHAVLTRSLNASRPLTMQLDADAAPELVLGRVEGGSVRGLRAYDADGATPVEIARFDAVAGTTIITVAPVGPMTEDYDQPFVVTSDGYGLILDRAFAVTNRITEGEFVLPGMRMGGYYSGAQGKGQAALIAGVGVQPSILAPDSRGVLLRLEAGEASIATPPTAVDELPGARWPALADLDGGGDRELVVQEGQDVVVRAAEPGFAEIWRAPGAADRQFLADVLPAVLRPTVGHADLVLPRATPSAQLVVAALDGASGSALWASAPRSLPWGVQNFALHAAGDLTGDGVADVAASPDAPLFYGGTDGAVVRTGAGSMVTSDPLIADATGDGTFEVFFHGGWHASRMLDPVPAGFPALWTVVDTGDMVWTNAYGAAVTCGGAPAVVAGASGRPELWVHRGSDGTVLADRVLAAGDSYAPGAVPPGVRTGTTGNVTAVADLDGTGRPALLVGSTDGHLYALDPCTLDALWAVDLRYPVGEPVVGDVDGDGTDDVVVGAADGYLYGIGDAAYPAPAVRDIDPASATPDADVDTIDTRDTLHAAWDAVPGATAYLVGVFTLFGSEIRFPNYRDVGNVTATDLTGLPLTQGQFYVVAVQAAGPDGPGLEGRSDGVMVSDARGPTAEVSVAPSPAWPVLGIEPTISALCEDAVGLRSLRVEILSADGATVVRRLLEEDVAAPMVRRDLPWDGREEGGWNAAEGGYLAQVTCIDLGAREASAQAAFELRPPEEPGDGGDGGDGGDDGGPPSGGSAEGCSCRAIGEPAAVPAVGVLLVGLAVVLSLTKRRREGRPERRNHR